MKLLRPQVPACQLESTGIHLPALAFQPQVAVWIRSQRMSAASLVQCTIHKNLHFNNSATRLNRQLVMASEVIFV